MAASYLYPRSISVLHDRQMKAFRRSDGRETNKESGDGAGAGCSGGDRGTMPDVGSFDRRVGVI